jgi:hypothetical protein
MNAKESVPTPASMAEVPSVRLTLRDWINDVFSWRHGTGEEKAWPVVHGESFEEIAQRCFGDRDRLISDSFQFAKTIGLVGRDADPDVFAQRFLVIKEHVFKKDIKSKTLPGS